MNEIMDNKIKFIVNNFSKQLMRMDEADVEEIYQDMLDTVTEETLEMNTTALSATFEHILEDGTCCTVDVSGTLKAKEYIFGSEDIQVRLENTMGFDEEPLDFDLLSEEDKDTIEQACLFALMDSNEEEV